MDVQLAKRLTRATSLLLLDHPFFGTLATRLKNVEDPSAETVVTDGVNNRWNPEYLRDLSDPQLRGVLVHLVLHAANGHTWRRGARKPTSWNEACDKAINHIIRESGLTLPPDALYPALGEEGKAAEHLYSTLTPIEDPEGGSGEQGEDGEGKPNPEGSPNGAPGKGQQGASTPKTDPGGCGAVEDAPKGDLGAGQAEEWKVAVAQATLAAESQGNLPGFLKLMVHEILDPVVPWEALLRDFVERSARNDYNWTRPNRRHLQRGIILPSLISEELPEIVVAVDTSGSIGQAQLDRFAAEASAVLGAYETTIRLIYVDTRVAHEETVTRADLPLHLKPHGGGGTDFRPAFEWVAEQGIQPACFIYLTDLCGPTGDVEPAYPVLWICTTDRKAPWGETVKM